MNVLINVRIEGIGECFSSPPVAAAAACWRACLLAVKAEGLFAALYSEFGISLIRGLGLRMSAAIEGRKAATAAAAAVPLVDL